MAIRKIPINRCYPGETGSSRIILLVNKESVSLAVPILNAGIHRNTGMCHCSRGYLNSNIGLDTLLFFYSLPAGPLPQRPKSPTANQSRLVHVCD